MSDLRIALVAEGPTDKVAIEAFLSAITDQDFVLTMLQPEAVDSFGGFGPRGSGWCGVARWCKDKAAAGFGAFEDDPGMKTFDALILHIDGDVADKGYSDCKPNLSGQDLPLSFDPTFISQRVDALRSVICGWLGVETVGERTVFCIPHLTTEAWVIACLFGDESGLGDRLESSAGLDQWLSLRSIPQRLHKNKKEYLQKKYQLKEGWPNAVRACSQAARFQRDVENAFSPPR